MPSLVVRRSWGRGGSMMSFFFFVFLNCETRPGFRMKREWE